MTHTEQTNPPSKRYDGKGMGDKHMPEGYLSEEDFNRIKRGMVDVVHEHVPKILNTQFELIGIDISTAESRGRVRGNLAFLDGIRLGAAGIKRSIGNRLLDAFGGCIIAMITGLVAVAWVGKSALH